MHPTSLALTAFLLSTGAAQAEVYSVDVWADNWFEMRINGEKIAEDSVPITTERSFNAESFVFEADPPFVIGLVAKDFVENDTGLEYIGTDRQQLGDGGVIVQVRNAAGEIAAVTNVSWQCLVTHAAPLDEACAMEVDPVAGEGSCGFETREEPEGWDTADFDASDWPQADVYSEADVSPRDGYDEVLWDIDARLIWGPDLKRDNTILCRKVVD